MGLGIIMEDIILDEDELGIADNMTEVDESFSTIVSSDEKAAVGSIVYFGADLDIGDIGEVKGKVTACEPIDQDLFAITIEIQALDSRYVGLLTKTLKGECDTDASEEQPVWGVGLRQTNGALATLINCPSGLLNADQLEKITHLTRQGHGLAKLTHAQRVILLLKPEQMETVKAELETVGLRIGVLHTGVRNIRACCGALCQFSQGTDALALGIEIDKALYGRSMKFDVKIAISDCLRNCMESYCVDIGLIANQGAYDVFVGGVASSGHLKGLKLTGGVDKSDVVALIEQILQWYDQRAQKGERLYKALIRIGSTMVQDTADSAFTGAIRMFEGLGNQKDIAQYLEKSLSRSWAVKQMREDLGL